MPGLPLRAGVTAIAFVCALSGALLPCATAPAQGGTPSANPRTPGELLGRPLPEARTRPLREGDTGHNPADHAGHPLLLAFYATWCGNCRRMEPSLRELHARYAPAGLRMLALSTESRGLLMRHQNQRPVPWLLGQTTGHAMHRYAALSLPTYVLADEAGVVRATWVGGGERTRAQLRSAVHALMSR